MAFADDLIIRLQEGIKQYLVRPDHTIALTVLFLLGLNVVYKNLLQFGAFFFNYFIRPGKDLKGLGEWAVVTGATDGIGRAYASALAKKGLNVVLISRTQSKLDETAKLLQQRYKVKTVTVAADFANADANTWSTIDSAIKNLPIGVLVNNVGLSYDHAEYFDLVDEQLVKDLIQINITATTKMCHLVLPGMKARKQGAIVNIGSGHGSVLPAGPLYAVYAASKAYVDMLTRSLDMEYRPLGVTVTDQAPLYVATKMSKIRVPRLDAPSPAVWAASAVNHIGYEPISSPYWFHAILWGIVSRLPLGVVNYQIVKMHMGLRNRYYKKLERANKASKAQ